MLHFKQITVKLFSFSLSALFWFLLQSINLFSEELVLKDYNCSKISFSYGGSSIGLPSLSPIMEAELSLAFFDNPISLKDLIESELDYFSLSLRDLHSLAEIPLHYLKSLGYEGLVVFPDPNQIDPITGVDLREENDKNLHFFVWVSRLQEVELENGGISEKAYLRLDSVLKKAPKKEKGLLPAITSDNLRLWNRLGRSPSRNSQVVLSPGDEPGHVIAIVKLLPKENPRFSLQASNSGTKTTGKIILGAHFSNDQFSGSDDRIDLSYITSDTGERKAYLFSYQRPAIFPDLLVMGMTIGYSNYDASTFAVTKIDFAGETRSGDLFARWNPLGSEFENHSLSFEFAIKGERIKSSNSLIMGEADANVVTPRIAVKVSTRGKYLRTETELSIRGNINPINEVDQVLMGGVKTKDKFQRLSLSYMESFKLGKWLDDTFTNSFLSSFSSHIIITKLKGSYALNEQRNLPHHQFITGGTGTVRGYPESPIAGDSGYSISLDYRIPFPLTNFGDNKNLKSTLIPFFDWGETFIKDPLFYESDHSILGVGVGVELSLPFGGVARIDFAQPLREIINNGSVLEGSRSGDHRVHALVNWKF